MSGTRNSSAYMLMFPSLCSWSFWRERDLLLLLLDLEHLDDEELVGGVLAALDHEARDDLRALHVAALLLDELDALAADRQRVLLDHVVHLLRVRHVLLQFDVLLQQRLQRRHLALGPRELLLDRLGR